MFVVSSYGAPTASVDPDRLTELPNDAFMLAFDALMNACSDHIVPLRVMTNTAPDSESELLFGWVAEMVFAFVSSPGAPIATVSPLIATAKPNLSALSCKVALRICCCVHVAPAAPCT